MRRSSGGNRDPPPTRKSNTFVRFFAIFKNGRGTTTILRKVIKPVQKRSAILEYFNWDFLFGAATLLSSRNSCVFLQIRTQTFQMAPQLAPGIEKKSLHPRKMRENQGISPILHNVAPRWSPETIVNPLRRIGTVNMPDDHISYNME